MTGTSASGLWPMRRLAELAAGLALAGAAVCWCFVAAPELPALRDWLVGTASRLLRVEQVRVDLAQAALHWLSPWRGVRPRPPLAGLAGVAGYPPFCLAGI